MTDPSITRDRPRFLTMLSLVAGSDARQHTLPGGLEDLAFASVTELAALVRRRLLSSVDLTRMYLARLKRYDPVLKCMITLCEDLALKQAHRGRKSRAAAYRGVVRGIPWGAKDLLAVKEYRMTWGAAPYKDQLNNIQPCLGFVWTPTESRPTTLRGSAVIFYDQNHLKRQVHQPDAARREPRHVHRQITPPRTLLEHRGSDRQVAGGLMKRVFVAVSLCCVVGVAGVRTQESASGLDYATLTKIRDEGLNRSQAMDHVSWLADVYGPRLQGSPAMRQAGDWVAKTLTTWGLVNVRQEKWPFGKGWQLERFSAHMIEPQVLPLIGVPRSWSPGTAGAVIADVVRVGIRSEADFQKYRGTLAGKIVLTQLVRDVKMLEGIIVQRWNDPLLKEAMTMPIPQGPPAPEGGEGGRGPTLADRIQQFFVEEHVAAAFDRGSDASIVPGDNQMSWRTQRTDGGTVFPSAAGPHDGANAGKMVPSVTLAVEHYNRMLRILDKGLPVKVELDLRTRFFDETEPNGFNVLADLPGSDPTGDFVLLGAHLDSVGTGGGATDNAAGTAVMMEAMRILKTVGAKPRRTIRLALWGGEEEGLLGSKAYVQSHLADPKTMALKPEHQKISAYYNLDNGTGRIHGVWMQGNLAIIPIFESWIRALRDFDVTTLTPQSVRGSDYLSFDDVGIPAFQFMQDRLEYNSRTHHSNMDVVDRVQRDDLVQMAVVVATFAYNTAAREDKLPRKPLPRPAPSGRSSQ
jgi:carboxypeptidase Q